MSQLQKYRIPPECRQIAHEVSVRKGLPIKVDPKMAIPLDANRPILAQLEEMALYDDHAMIDLERIYDDHEVMSLLEPAIVMTR